MENPDTSGMEDGKIPPFIGAMRWVLGNATEVAGHKIVIPKLQQFQYSASLNRNDWFDVRTAEAIDANDMAEADMEPVIGEPDELTDELPIEPDTKVEELDEGKWTRCAAEDCHEEPVVGLQYCSKHYFELNASIRSEMSPMAQKMFDKQAAGGAAHASDADVAAMDDTIEATNR